MRVNAISLTPSLICRFWTKVDKTTSSNGCWLWTDRVNPNGYGRIDLAYPDAGQLLAHRVSYTIHLGEIPTNTLVLHNCPGGDNPACVNPSHLWLGTQLENMRDMWAKGRHGPLPRYYGENHWSHIHKDKVVRGDKNGSHLHPERLRRGETTPWSKLTEDQVRQIRLDRADGETIQSLARRFGVSRPTVDAVVARKTWRHVI